MGLAKKKIWVKFIISQILRKREVFLKRFFCSSELEAAGIRFDITDNGCGIEHDSLLQLQESLQKEAGISCHIGLVNTHKRIRLAYGSHYGITVVSRLMEGTRISILIARDDIGQSSDSFVPPQESEFE